MPLPSGFPLYRKGKDYHVSLSFPGPDSIISKSIGEDTKSALMIPNADFLIKFVEGNIGINDSMQKSTIIKNLNSPIASSNEMVFKNFAKLNKIELDSDISKYKKESGKLSFPMEELELNPANDLLGLKALETTTLKSIFETQKPYMEIAKLVIENLGKIEDVVARVMPLVSISPLTTKSMKPFYKDKNISGPKSIGFQGGEEFKKEISNIQSILNIGEDLLGSESNSNSNNDSGGGSNSNSNSDSKESGGSNEGDWQIVSTIYSTGEFNPNVDYTYTYIDLPKDEEIKPETNNIDLIPKDPYHPYKPKKVIFGIWDSKGNPINPLESVKTIGLNSNGDIIEVNTPFKKADWILRSPKWVLDNTYQWPSFNRPFYVWKRRLLTKISQTNPDTGAEPAWEIKKYKKGDTNLITKEGAIEGDPVISSFESNDVSSYENLFTEHININVFKSDLKETEKAKIRQDILSRLKTEETSNGENRSPIETHLQNVTLYSQTSSSFYKRINGKDPIPTNLKRPFKPFRIISNESQNDDLLKRYASAYNKDPKLIWIEPEADYELKVIRVDPVTKIEYKETQGEPSLPTNIKKFIKNIVNIRLSNNQPFNISVRKNTQSEEIVENITNYRLENWNYERSTTSPRVENNNTFIFSIWSDIPPTEFNNDLKRFTTKGLNDEYFYDLEKEGNKWSYRKWKWKVDVSDIVIQSVIGLISPYLLLTLYALYAANPEAEYTFNEDGVFSYTVKLKDLFPYRVYELIPPGDRILEHGGRKYIVRLDSVGNITRWYYVKDRTFDGPSLGTNKNINGKNNIVINRQSYDDESLIPKESQNTSTTQYLPPFGYERTFIIDYNSKPTKREKDLEIISNDVSIPIYNISVDSTNTFGAIIDPSKIRNEQLTTDELFSNGKYGTGTPQDPQEIEVIKRYQLTDLDTESYYIIEGRLIEETDTQENNQTGNVQSVTGDGNQWYRMPDALGVFKVFISIISDIFTKLIPAIEKLITLFKNPIEFITSIISEKMGESFAFLSKESLKDFQSGLDIKSEIPNFNSEVSDERLRKLDDDGKKQLFDDEKKKKREKDRKVKELKDFFKKSNLSNFVYVNDDGDFGSILDGVAGIPFSIFGKDLPFGLKMDFGNVPGSPVGLEFPTKINFNKVKNLQNIVSPPKVFEEKSALDISEQLRKASEPLKLDNKYPFSLNERGDRKDGKNTDQTKIKFKDGTSIFVNDNSLQDFIIANETKFNFIYIEENINNRLKEVDELIEEGTKSSLRKALASLTDLSKLDPKNKIIEEKKSQVREKITNIEMSDQPLLKMILGLVSFPVKVIASIIEWIMNFFKSLVNPITLPSKVIEFLSFQWMTQFFTPKGILEIMGIKFKPEKLAEWFALSKLPTIPDDFDLADLSEFLNVAFNVKLPTYNKKQYSGIKPTLPLRLLTSLFCFIEKLINGVIDFVWSTLGIEAVIPPPHIKLCSGSDLESMNPEDIAKVLNGEIPRGANDGGTDNDGDGKNDDFEGFYYEVELPDGSTKRFLDREQLDKFIEDNKDINYDFTF